VSPDGDLTCAIASIVLPGSLVVHGLPGRPRGLQRNWRAPSRCESLEGLVVCDGTGRPRLEVSRWKASWSATELAGPVSM
jgi:hypothetical protein